MLNNGKVVLIVFSMIILLFGLTTINAVDNISDDGIIRVNNDMSDHNLIQDDVTTQNKQIKSSIQTRNVTDFNSLRQVWGDIQENGEENNNYTINLQGGTYIFTEPLRNGAGDVNLTIILNGMGLNKDVVFDGQNTTTMFNMTGSSQIICLNNLTIQNCSGDDEYIINTGGCYIENCVFMNNSCNAVCTQNLKCNNSNFDNNNADILITINDVGNNLITNSNFINNTISSNMILFSGNLTIDGCMFINNIVRDNILEIDGNYPLFRCNNTCFISNKVSLIYYAGYLYNYSVQEIDNCLFKNNTDQKGNLAEIFYFSGTARQVIINNSYFDGFRNPAYAGISSFYDKSDNIIITVVNHKSQTGIFSQLDKTLTINVVKVGEFSYYDDINIPGEYVIKITSDKNYIAQNIILNSDNKYTTIINLEDLPGNFEDFNIYADGIKIATVKNKKTGLIFNPVIVKTGSNVTFNATFSDDGKLLSSGKVVFKINGKTIGSTRIEFGTASYTYNLPLYTAKDYNLTVKYGGSKKIAPVEKTTTLTLTKVDTKTKINTKIENNTLEIDVETSDENNNIITNTNTKISIKINGKTVKTTTTTNGKTTYTYPITKGQNGKQITITAISGENSRYKTSTSQKTVKLEYTDSTKTPKKDTNNVFHVSNTGSDTNTGSQNSPYKTIQHAINMVNQTGIPTTIYITEGVYKGVGNTNLTIPGDLQLNITGLGNVRIEGEVNYTYSSGEGYYWGSSRIWEPYLNGTGNWAMNITKGTGLITISNITIQNCWSTSSHDSSTVDNYANLVVNNVSFINNHAKIGAGIRNNNGATLTVNNSLFEKNRKSDTTGNYGAGIYNNGTVTVINTIFKNNYARWGTVTNEKNMTLINCTICDNIGYDGASPLKIGSGIVSNPADTPYFESDKSVNGVSIVVDGCTFINNDQIDLYLSSSHLTLINSVFNRSTGVIVTTGTNQTRYNANITNNTLTSLVISTVDKKLSESSYENVVTALKLSGYYRYTIESNNITNITGSRSKAMELTTEKSTIRNNTFSRVINILSNGNKLTGNTINTTQDFCTIYLAGYENNTITSNYLITIYGSKGNSAINSTSDNNIIRNNRPWATYIEFNDNTFLKYFDEEGNLKEEYTQAVTEFRITGGLNNRQIQVNKSVRISQSGQFVSNNLTIIVNNINITASSVTAENTNQKPIFVLNSNNNIIRYTYLKTNAQYTIFINNTTNNSITGNELIGDFFTGDESISTTVGNTISRNTPGYRKYTLTNETYSTYFDENGVIKLNGDHPIGFILAETLVNKNIILNNNQSIQFTSYNGTKLINTTITTQYNTLLNLSNITINNTNQKAALELKSPENNITDTNITTNANAIIIENATNLMIQYNNITTTGNLKTTISIINSQATKENLRINSNIIITESNSSDLMIYTINAINTTGLNIANNNITTIHQTQTINDGTCSINLQNPETYEVYNRIYGNNIITRGNYVYGVNLTNQIIYMQEGLINTEAQVYQTAIQTKNIKSYIYYSTIYGIKNINLISKSNSEQMILDNCENLLCENINFNIQKNSTGLKIINSSNITLKRSTFTINNNSKAIQIEENKLIYINSNNITSQSDISPISLENTRQTKIVNNTVNTLSNYAISINTQSQENLVNNNILYAEKFADDAVEVKNSNNLVYDNTPIELRTYFYLNNKTYNQFFNENGQLKDNIPEGLTIEVTSSLYDKILNITKPVNIIIENANFENCTLIISSDCVNISKVNLIGENCKIIINSNNSNININTLTVKNTQNTNFSPVKINGNKNNITLNKLDIITANQNSNLTLVTVNGDNNNITFKDGRTYDFNKTIGILFNNSNNNTFYLEFLISDAFELNNIILNNSNDNFLNLSQLDCGDVDRYVGLRFINSSRNIITGSSMVTQGEVNDITMVVIGNNSNNNLFKKFNMGNSRSKRIPIIINNSNYNAILGCSLSYANWQGYAVEIINSTGNKIKYNYLRTASFIGNSAIKQEAINEVVQNQVLYNSVGSYATVKTNITVEGNVKLDNNITITANVLAIKNWRYENATSGVVIFIVNGVNTGSVNVVNGTATIDYKITGMNDLKIEIIYEDPSMTNEVNFNQTTINIEKLNTTTILENTTNIGVQTTIKATIIDENNNTVNEGKVAFKLNGKTIGTVQIINGVATITVNTESYALKNYTITAVYGGSDSYNKSMQNSTLTLAGYRIIVKVDNITTTNGKTVKIKVTACDINGIAISEGKVSFKLNGKTLKNAQSNTIIAEIKNGVATLDYDVTSMTPKEYLITAVVSGKNFDTQRENATLTVIKDTQKVELITGKVKRTNNTTISAKITSQDKPVTRKTKVSIKFNGKTVMTTYTTNGLINVKFNLTGYKNPTYNITIIAGENTYYKSATYTGVLKIE